jgi:hypothetical protein
MKIFFIVTANDFGSPKTNPEQSPKHHFCECLATLSISGVAAKLLNSKKTAICNEGRVRH